MHSVDIGIDIVLAIHSTVDDDVVDKFTAAPVWLAARAGSGNEGGECLQFTHAQPLARCSTPTGRRQRKSEEYTYNATSKQK